MRRVPDNFLPLLLLALAWPASAGDISVVNEGGIRDRWMLADGVKLAVPAYPPRYARRHDTVCLGVGYLITVAGATFQTDKVFVGVLIITFAGVGLTAVLQRIEERFSTWRPRLDEEHGG